MMGRWLREWFQPRSDHRAEPISAEDAARRLAQRQHARERNRIISKANAMRAQMGKPAWPLRPE